VATFECLREPSRALTICAGLLEAVQPLYGLLTTDLSPDRTSAAEDIGGGGGVNLGGGFGGGRGGLGSAAGVEDEAPAKLVGYSVTGKDDDLTDDSTRCRGERRQLMGRIVEVR